MKNEIKHQIDRINQEVGVTIKNPRDVLPPTSFTYGKPNKKREIGVQQVLTEWQEHHPSPKRIYVKEPNSKRRNEDIIGSSSVKTANKPANSFAFGIKSGEHEPIKAIINNDYGNESEIALKKHYDAYFNTFGVKNKKKCASTNSSLLHEKKKDKDKAMPKAAPIKRERVFTKQDLPQMEKYDHIQSIVSKNITKFKTYNGKHSNTSS